MVAKSPTTSVQLVLDLFIEKEVEIDGIGMGVLSDGTAYLTGRGLARLCGIDHTNIQDISKIWEQGDLKQREEKIRDILNKQEYDSKSIYIQIKYHGTVHHAFPDVVCMAILEYYAFELKKDIALQNFRILARKTFREFVYAQVGFDPRRAIPEVWRQFHDRVVLVYDSVPSGYFSVFKELSDVVVTLIRSGADVGKSFVPDISVGQLWAKKWKLDNMRDDFGERKEYNHNYPDYFPQAASNPQQVWCYPDAALAEFRKWMREVYLPQSFPNYLENKVKQGSMPASFKELALLAIEQKTKT